MEVNVHQWRREQSFFHRLLQWLDILDPTTLLASNKEIENALTLLQGSLPSLKETVRDEKIKEALKLTLSSIHPDTADVLPTIFRASAFMPFATPLVVAMLLPHKGMKPAVFWQFLFQSYSAGYNLVNRNKTTCKDEKVPLKQVLLLFGAVTYTTCLGVSPQFVMHRYASNSPVMYTVFKKILPVPVLAFASALNVAIVRGFEFDKGIEVADKNGNVVGVSQLAGTKAIKETALSRAVLVGATVTAPNILVGYLQRTNFIRRFPFGLAPIRHIMTAFVFGLMVPFAFSLYPQTGKIKRSNLEPLIQSATTEEDLYYNRGL
ncbi:sideroflexin-4 isoform X1 [Scyliorhinus canicula]|uniref:sideroflexin-4 isoform X1 n=1 Tax=Scyliorhinus canicula TaxID=7830 RepID=UPI0018F74C54|nr:sideroflexin-4 isoform X1 [Scyliorhinus canicula]